MANELQHIPEMIALWTRREVASPADVVTVFDLAHHVEEEHKSAQSILAFAWRLTEEYRQRYPHRLADEQPLCRCRSAAASISHCSRSLLEVLGGHVGDTVRPLFLLGSLGASQALLGAWDLLPGGSAVLVPQHNSDHIRIDLATAVRCLPRGLSWANPGRLVDFLHPGASMVPLNGGHVLVPAPAVLLALTAPVVTQETTVDTLIFCAAALQAAAAGTWQRAEQIARTLGHGEAPLQAALRLRLDGRLGLQVPPARRVTMAVRRLLASEGLG